MSLEDSELILNDDGSIYHLNLQPHQIAHTIITVGDPERVSAVTQHFDLIEHSVSKREFHTQTGFFKGKKLTVISTGIGTDNIDIVLNELDALVNIDFKSKQVKQQLTQLDIVRIGTSGTIRKEIPVDSWLISDYAIGFDTLLRHYQSEGCIEETISEAFVEQTNWNLKKGEPYVVKSDGKLFHQLFSEKTMKGFTATNVGFYGPQGRSLRLNASDPHMHQGLIDFEYNGMQLTNLEMETSGIYGLAKLLGHRAISMNAILANRATGTFSQQPKQVVDGLIEYTLNRLVSAEPH